MERRVPPSGDPEATLAWVGEAPAREEVRLGEPFVGATGQILWTLAPRYAGVSRPGAWVTNWSKAPLEDKKSLTEEQIRDLNAELLDELHGLVNLQTIVTLGQYATQALLTDVNLYWGNGLAFRVPPRWTVVPVVHPAAGMHESSMLERTAHGLAGVRRYLETGRVWHPDHSGYDYHPSLAELQDILHGGTLDVAIDTEGTSEEPFCLTFSLFGEHSYLIYDSEGDKLVVFRNWLQKHRPRIIMHNAVWDLDVLLAMGIDVRDFEIRDTMVDAYVLQDLPKDLKNLGRRLVEAPMVEYLTMIAPWQAKADKAWRRKAYGAALEHVQLVQQFTPKGRPKMSKGQPVFKVEGPRTQLQIKKHIERNQKMALQEVAWAEMTVGPRPNKELKLAPPEVHVPYAGRDARVTYQLAPMLRKRVEDEGLIQVATLDHDVLPMIFDMQQTGLHLDLDRFWEVAGFISQERLRVKAELQELLGNPEFNPGSADQVEAALREHEYELEKRTPSGKRFSTDSNVLRILKERYGDTEFLDRLLNYRELAKYEDSYTLPVMKLITELPGGEFRLFPNLRGTTVVSGRLSAHSPNVLAWPARTKLGLMLRSIFTAPPGKVLVSWDLSQIELRLAAAFSNDPVMTEAFVAGRDLHANLAAQLFGLSYEFCLGPGKLTHRYPAKTIHYLLLYGGGGAKLYEELRGAGVTGFTLQDCYALVDSTWATYKGVQQFMLEAAREAKQHGYVQDFLGRRRFLPGAQLVEGGFGWALKKLRLEAERQAGNHKIQGGAAEIIKRAMYTTWTEVYPKCDLRLWLQIHDELLGELPEDQWERTDRMMREVMQQDSWLTAPIPIEATGQFGRSWSDLK